MKTSELIGPALDWAVEVAEGRTPTYRSDMCAFMVARSHERATSVYEYSTDWAQGGPIIERECITWSMVMNPEGSDETRWLAFSYRHGSSKAVAGPSQLIAAMRCFVASKLGDEVEIPEELK